MKKTLLIISTCLLAASMVDAGPKCDAAKSFLEEKKAELEAHKDMKHKDKKHKGTHHSRLKKMADLLNKTANLGKDEKKCERLHKRLDKKLSKMKGMPAEKTGE